MYARLGFMGRKRVFKRMPHVLNPFAQVESAAGVGDFEPISGQYGQVFAFRGNECEHYTECNLTGRTRVSMDFRVIRQDEISRCPVLESTALELNRKQHKGGASEYFTLGRYYKKTFSNE